MLIEISHKVLSTNGLDFLFQIKMPDNDMPWSVSTEPVRDILNHPLF